MVAGTLYKVNTSEALFHHYWCAVCVCFVERCSVLSAYAQVEQEAQFEHGVRRLVYGEIRCRTEEKSTRFVSFAPTFRGLRRALSDLDARSIYRCRRRRCSIPNWLRSSGSAFSGNKRAALFRVFTNTVFYIFILKNKTQSRSNRMMKRRPVVRFVDLPTTATKNS